MLSNTFFAQFLQDPKTTLIFFLLAFPGRVMALSVHEFAHAWVANRCGDPTARLMGRMTINPLKHLDPLGTLLMLVMGFGWAKPVPVNPLHYKNYRRDDLLVSIAGVTMNMIMFLLSMLVMFAILAATVARAPMLTETWSATAPDVYRTVYGGEQVLVFPEDGGHVYVTIANAALALPFISDVITDIYGAVPGYLYQMLCYFAMVNLGLCVFNLIPMPPLDGYHVLNDLVLKKNLFANPYTARMCYMVLVVLILTGTLGRGLGWVDGKILDGVCQLARMGRGALGLA